MPMSPYATGFELPAPELDVSEWVGAPTSLAELRGEVVMIEAFQMLCPGCVANGLPQAQKVHRGIRDVTVLGLHTVFENHDVMGPDALRVFLNEYRYTFPVAIDRADAASTMPVTMRAYLLEGTPSTILIDRAGKLRYVGLGALSDLELGVRLGILLDEPRPDPVPLVDAGA